MLGRGHGRFTNELCSFFAPTECLVNRAKRSARLFSCTDLFIGYRKPPAKQVVQ